MPAHTRLKTQDDLFTEERHRMVEHQLVTRGIQDARVLEAMRTVPREVFVDASMAEFAYVDSPLPIAEGQTMSQPYIVALMAELAELDGTARVLEVGAGSGYGAAVYAHIAAEVFSIERHAALVDGARRALERAGAQNVTLRHGDGSRGWPEKAPFDAIIVTAGAAHMPESLKQQLAPGGRLVIPVDADGHQQLLRIRRDSGDRFTEENFGAVAFVPLVAGQGGNGPQTESQDSAGETVRPAARMLQERELVEALREAIEPLPEIDDPGFASRFDRLGDATVAGLGEATHGTSEFYRARAAISRRLIEKHGFTIVALEADWPDAARIDRYVRHREPAPWEQAAFTRFPTWMWRNEETAEFIEWLRAVNAERPPEQRVSVHGLDLYALAASIEAVIAYLERVDPQAAAVARERYGCLTPWQKDPAAYGRAAVTKGLADCEGAVVSALEDLLRKRLDYAAADPDDFLDAEGNARLIKAAEEYYRTIYYGDVQSWNLRDRHMFDTLQRVRSRRPAPAKAVVWAHNSHIGDSQATEMGIVREEVNIGQLCREHLGSDAALAGFGTYDGEVMAARDWGGPGEVRTVRPARKGSIEDLCRRTGESRFRLDLGAQAGTPLAYTLLGPRLQRAIGVVYRPETELASHYMDVSLPGQFDHYVWFERTSPVRPLAARRGETPAETWPFGL
ncbi:MAG: protein-L-isoaspartate(D-aspartate) O-methyltransferase [Alphaproteobacteria bacterium]